MIQYIAYGIFLAIGFHIGGKVSMKLRLGPKNKSKVELNKGEGIRTNDYVSKFYGGI